MNNSMNTDFIHQTVYAGYVGYSTNSSINHSFDTRKR